MTLLLTILLLACEKEKTVWILQYHYWGLLYGSSLQPGGEAYLSKEACEKEGQDYMQRRFDKLRDQNLAKELEQEKKEEIKKDHEYTCIEIPYKFFAIRK